MVQDYSKMNKSYQQSSSVKIGTLMEVLSRPGVHRVPLTGRNDKIIRLVTQSEMIDFILNNKVAKTFWPDQVLNRKLRDSMTFLLFVLYNC